MLNDELLSYFENVYSIKSATLQYIFTEYPNSHYDEISNTLYLLGPKIETLTYFIIGDSDLININDVLNLCKTHGLNINAVQTIRNYINVGKLPKPLLYVGRYAYFDKASVETFLNDNY